MGVLTFLRMARAPYFEFLPVSSLVMDMTDCNRRRWDRKAFEPGAILLRVTVL